MAGIGWKLERMLERGSLAGMLGAYLTGVAVTSAPWLLTTAVLVAMRLLIRGHVGAAEFTIAEQITTVVYAMTLVASAPVHVVVSRYAADRLYERRPGAIARPLRYVLGATLLGALVLGVVAMEVLQAPPSLAWLIPVLTVLVGAQWLLLGVGGGLSSPGVVLRAFGIGTAVAIAGSFTLERTAHLGALGCLLGFATGQAVTMIGMLIGVLRSLPAAEDPCPPGELRTAFREYRLLALSAFAFHFSVWADKLVVWLLAGRDRATIYASASALAWFSVIPAFAWIYVEMETGFYRKFRRFYEAITAGARLTELRLHAEQLRREAVRILRGAAAIQLAVMVLAIAVSEYVVAMMGLPRRAIVSFQLVVVGAAPQVIALLGMLLLYYFDLRRNAFVAACAHLAACIALTAAACLLELPDGAGFAAASVSSTAIVLRFIQRRLNRLVLETFQSQPYNTAHDSPRSSGGRSRPR
jgi:uncharacterized membrane protein